MTSLMAHTALLHSQPNADFCLKSFSRQIFFGWTCVHLITSQQKSSKVDFQSQFCKSKKFNNFDFFSVKIIGLGEQLMIKPFFDNFIFWNSLFYFYFYWLIIKWGQVQAHKYLAGSTFWTKFYIWLDMQLCAPKVRSYLRCILHSFH